MFCMDYFSQIGAIFNVYHHGIKCIEKRNNYEVRLLILIYKAKDKQKRKQLSMNFVCALENCLFLECILSRYPVGGWPGRLWQLEGRR